MAEPKYVHFVTSTLFTLTTTGEMAGAVEFHFLSPDGNTYVTLLGPLLTADLSGRLTNALSRMPEPPEVRANTSMQAPLKGTPHSGTNTATFFGQSFNKRLLELVGLLIIRANLLESALVRLLASILELRTDMAEAIFYSSQNTKARLDMILAALNASDIHPKTRAEIAKALDQVSNASQTRNMLVHGEWSFSGEKFSVIEKKALGKKQKQSIQTEKSILELSQRFHDLSGLVGTFAQSINTLRSIDIKTA
jgi:hypothetical protein